MFLTEQHYKKLNKLYYHGQVFKDRDSSVTDYSCYYLTTDPFYAYQYSGPDGYIKIHRLKKSLNICNLKSKQDRLTVENYCRKNKLKNPLIQLDILSEEDWLTHFQNNKNREDFILILKELNYDGFFNVEIEDKIRGRILRSDESLGFPAIGIFDESNLITIQTIHGFENILKLPDIQKIHEKEKNTIILVSHSMEDVAKLADRLLVMNGGKVEFFDKPANVFKNEIRLKEIGLDVPQVLELGRKLREKGFDISDDILTIDDIKNEIVRILGRK